jgi:hypothetical protein
MDSSFADTLSDKIFYFHPQNGHDKYGKPIYDTNHWIAAKLLFTNGAAVPNPNAGRSNIPNMYLRLNANGQIDESSILSGQYNDAVQHYFLVPANYSPAEAEAFAEQVNEMLPEAAKKP